jgi:hypothetical protein
MLGPKVSSLLHLTVRFALAFAVHRQMARYQVLLDFAVEDTITKQGMAISSNHHH